LAGLDFFFAATILTSMLCKRFVTQVSQADPWRHLKCSLNEIKDLC
jgi:hypothetical protein